MNSLIKEIKNFFLVIFVLCFCLIKNSYSKIYEEIKVVGNERLSVETIIMFSGLKINEDINTEALNNSIKNLYKTDYFKDLRISINNNIITIHIVENPIIQKINLRGIKNKSLPIN